jgi:hypothetical protein
MEMSRNRFRTSLIAAGAALGAATAASGQTLDVLEPTTGGTNQYEYIGVGNVGDTTFVYFQVNVNAANETNGFFVRFLDGAGNTVQDTANFGDAVGNAAAGICQEVSNGDGDAILENNEVWRLDISSVMGAGIPVGAVRVQIIFDTDGSATINAGDHETVDLADGDNVAPSTDAADETLEIVTTRSIPNAAFFDGSGANTDLFITFTTPVVGLDPANTAVIPLFGKADVDGAISGDTTQSVNSVQPGGGAALDFEFQDGTQFNTAGAIDINAGSFSVPPGTTNVLNFDFDDANSSLDQGNAFRRDLGGTSLVRDSAGNLITDALVSPTLLQPLQVDSVDVLFRSGTGAGLLQVVYNRPLNPASPGNAAFYNNTNGPGNAIRLVVDGTPQNVGNLDVTAVNFDPTMPDRVTLNVNDAASNAEDIWTDALSVGSGGDFDAGSFEHNFSVTGTVPQASFGAAPDYNTSQTLGIGDLAQPVIIDTRTVDANGDGVVDGYDVIFSEVIQDYTGNTGIEINKVSTPVQPITGVDIYTGQLPAPVNTTFDNVNQINNLLPLTDVSTIDGDFFNTNGTIARDGTISPREMGNAVRLLVDPYESDFDGDGQDYNAGDLDELLPDTASFPYNVTWNNTNAAINNTVNTGTASLNPAAAVVDTAGNTFTNDTTFPFDTPVLVQAIAANDGAAPALIRVDAATMTVDPINGDPSICFNTGDNSANVTPTGFTASVPNNDTRLLFEQDGVVADQTTNNLARVITGETFIGGITTASVSEQNFSFGANADTFTGDNDFTNGTPDAFLNNNNTVAPAPTINPANANVAMFAAAASTDPEAFVPGITGTLQPDNFGRGLRDLGGNQLTFTNAIVMDCDSPFIPLVLDVNQQVQIGASLFPDASGNFAGEIRGVFTQPIDQTTLDANDFTVNFGADVLDATVDTNNPTNILFDITDGVISINNAVTFTYNGGLPGATLVASDEAEGGTGVPTDPANAATQGTAALPHVIQLQQPFVDTFDVAVMDFTGQLLLDEDIDGDGDDDPAPLGTKIYAFNPILVANEIYAEHNNVPFGYRTDDPAYTAGGVAATNFVDVYTSLTAFTNYLHGLRDDVYLHRGGSNFQRYTNTKNNPYNAAGILGDDNENGVLVDSMRMSINAGNLTRITFSGRGEGSGDRVNRGVVDLAWDFIRSLDGTMQSYIRQGWWPSGSPVPAGSAVIDDPANPGRFEIHVSRPIFKFNGLTGDPTGRNDLFRNVVAPLVFVAELPDGRRYALSGLGSSATDTDPDGVDGPLVPGGPIQFLELPGVQDAGAPFDAAFLDFRLANVGSHQIRAGWNVIPYDRASGIVESSNRNVPVLPSGVFEDDLNFINPSTLPWASVIDAAGVIWIDGDPTLLAAPSSVSTAGGANYPGGDGIWTAADDMTAASGVGAGPQPFMNSIFLDADRIPHFAFTMTTSGIQLNEGITSVVGGYAVAFYNNSYINGLHNNDFGAFQFGPALASTAVFDDTPISSGNRSRTQGWILGAITNAFANPTDFFSANTPADYVITFRVGRLNPPQGGLGVAQEPDGAAPTHSPVTIDVKSASAGGIVSPNDLGAVGLEGAFIHYAN